MLIVDTTYGTHFLRPGEKVKYFLIRQYIK